MERTEADILAREPLTIRFGATDYKIAPLSINKAKQWREQAVEIVKTITEVHGQECATNGAFTNGLAFFFLRFPEKMLELVLSYAGNLPKEVIEEEATDEQLAKAFGEIIKIAFPFTAELGMISKVMGMAQTFQR